MRRAGRRHCRGIRALHGIAVSADVALRAIDEILVLAVAAAFAHGETRITGVRETPYKESDRVAAIERLLYAAGIAVESLPNGIAIAGGSPRADGALVSRRTATTAPQWRRQPSPPAPER